MSAESIIEKYFNEEVDSSLSLLESYISEGVSLIPFQVISNAVLRVRNFDSIVSLSKDKSLIANIANVSNAFEDNLFDDGDSSIQNPTNLEAPKSKAEVETYLQKIHKWLSKFVNIDYADIKRYFNKIFAVVVKGLSVLGIAGTIAVATTTTAVAGVTGSAGLISFAVIISLIALYSCIINAVHTAEDMNGEKLTLGTAFSNTLSDIKNIFTSIKLSKGETSFAIISSVLTALFLYIKQFYSGKAVEYIKKGLVYTATNAHSLAKNTATKIAELIKKMPDSIKDKLKSTHDIGDTADIAKDFANKYDWGKVASKIFYIAIPVILILTTLYLFTRLIDGLNLERLRSHKKQEDTGVKSDEEYSGII